MRERIICCDISCPHRLGRIHRCLKKHATPIQYLVFLFMGTDTQLEECIHQLEQIMDTEADDIRVYLLPRRGLRLSLGRAALPEDVLWPAVNTHPENSTTTCGSSSEEVAQEDAPALYFV